MVLWFTTDFPSYTEKGIYVTNLKLYETAYKYNEKLKILIEYFISYGRMKRQVEKLAEFCALTGYVITKKKKMLKTEIKIKYKEYRFLNIICFSIIKFWFYKITSTRTEYILGILNIWFKYCCFMFIIFAIS